MEDTIQSQVNFIRSFLNSRGVDVERDVLTEYVVNEGIIYTDVNNLVLISEQLFHSIRNKKFTAYQELHQKSVDDEVVQSIKAEAKRLNVEIPVQHLNLLAQSVVANSFDWDSETVIKTLEEYLYHHQEIIKEKVQYDLNRVEGVAQQKIDGMKKEVDRVSSNIF